MAGCYGDDPEDKYFENRLMDHLDQYDKIYCDWCGAECSDDTVFIVHDQYICDKCIDLDEFYESLEE